MDHWWLLLALGIVFGSITGLSAAASATLGRQLVAAHDLATVSSWNQIGARLARMAGAPIGAALVTARGLPAVMVVDAATFLLAAGALALVRPRYRIHDTPTGQTWRAGLVDGFAYLGADRRALVFVIGLCGLNVFSSPLTGLGVPLRITAASWPATTLGVAEAVFSGAALAGSLGAALIRTRRQVSAAYLCLIVQGLAYAAVAAPSPPALYAAMGIIRLTAGQASVWLSATFVQVVDAAHLGAGRLHQQPRRSPPRPRGHPSLRSTHQPRRHRRQPADSRRRHGDHVRTHPRPPRHPRCHYAHVSPVDCPGTRSSPWLRRRPWRRFP